MEAGCIAAEVEGCCIAAGEEAGKVGLSVYFDKDLCAEEAERDEDFVSLVEVLKLTREVFPRQVFVFVLGIPL